MAFLDILAESIVLVSQLVCLYLHSPLAVWFGRRTPNFVSTFSLEFTNILTARTDGRKPIYMLALTLQIIGAIGVANAQTVTQLLGWRAMQAAGASSGLSVGMGVIGDIYRLEERGTASGIFFGVCLSLVFFCLSAHLSILDLY